MKRRTRIRRVENDALTKLQDEAKEKALDYYKLDKKIKGLMQEFKEMYEPTLNAMQAARLKAVPVGDGVEVVAAPTTIKGGTTVDINALYEKVSPDEFLACIKVQLEATRAVLPAKVLAEISETKPSTLGPVALAIKYPRKPNK